ncbi:hypothetical protein H6F67_10955 [Microcoleus sp. FACHB-1515]|uniref:hypothetical protein n=1 Tax=Cyanophyceae TaxID=3028117 RepID=UPI001688BC94|nr:hypothetical protein [Microcoleus sp. FACHB-1515]MBD2090373.1 hypothetical protein [Microcoleus sp. FACHB-1515]
MRSIDRFTTAQPRLDRRRGRQVKPKQQALLDRTAQRRREAGVLYDSRIFRPTREEILTNG